MGIGEDKNASYYGMEYESNVKQRIELARLLGEIGYEKYDFFVHQAGLARGSAEERALKTTKNKTPERRKIPGIMKEGLSIFPYATISETTNLIKNYKEAWDLAGKLLNYTYADYIPTGGAGEYKEIVNAIIAIPKTIELMPDGADKFDKNASTISVPFSRVIPDPHEKCVKYFPINDIMYSNNIDNINPEFVLGITCAGVDGVQPATFFNEKFLSELSPSEYNEKMMYWGELMKSHYGIRVPSKDVANNNADTQYDTPHSATDKIIRETRHSYANGSYAKGSSMYDFDFD